ncbi:hypothetical protein COV61_03195 [Candidatus Micrarchaeota archaeon CG11_big_fil_rev_8_21_14_0_20_47_5]|nr:MAG: hypothetical protein COV61_03195 [Candidatus Micrarchaeota archaeon CG11_big_fil_rev_8_21_14_0_20_47_5]
MERGFLFISAILLSLLIFGCASQTSSVEPTASNVNSSNLNVSAPPATPSIKPLTNQTNYSKTNVSAQSKISNNETLKIASWNLQIFGEKKAQNATLMAFYADTMRQYDITFIEEIRDSSGTAFPKLCALMEGYNCLNSSRAGRSSSKEQYGVIYKKVSIVSMKDYNPDIQDRWERPPFQITFKRGNYTFTALVEHAKPDDAPKEMSALNALASNMSGNLVVLGDLNADCNYYTNKTDFKGSWFWALKTGTDTTTGNTNCTYDRMIFNSDMKNEYIASGVFSDGINSSISDHYLVWSEIKTGE